MIDLWLDDIRPAPNGWVHVFTPDQAKPYLENREVRHASLDHDLGACESCLRANAPLSMTAEEWLANSNYETMPHCEHVGTGYTLVCWMEETGNWPQEKPTVHSANPVGRSRMQMVIDLKWARPK